MEQFNINKITSPRGLKKDQYDVVIIGAGIGGLVCGCYLAKAGLKVLIVEKNNKVGGYCTSFEREGFRFDAGVHGIGSLYSSGRVDNLIEELSLSIKFEEKDPAESIYFLDKYLINFWQDIKRTQEEFIYYFPKEKTNIIDFINFVLNTSAIETYARYRTKSFYEMFNEWFTDRNLKRCLCIPLGNLGVSAKMLSALAGLSLYREFLFRPHKYPKGGIQSFSCVLQNRFEELRGNLLLKSMITQVERKDNTIVIKDEKGEEYYGGIVIFNVAPHQIYQMVEDRNIKDKLKRIISGLIISPSAFFVNIGLKKEQELKLNGIKMYNLWYFPTSKVRGKDIFNIDYTALRTDNVFLSFPSSNTMRIFTLMSFKNTSYWSTHKEEVSLNLIKRASKIFSDFVENTELISVTTPVDLYNYTYNFKGACYGWLTVKDLIYNFPGFIKLGDNLFICGHWVPNIFGGSGIGSVVNSSKILSRYILKKKGEIQ